MIQAFVERAAQRHALDVPFLLAGADLLNEIIESVVGPIVGGDRDHAAAPHEKRECRLQQLVQLIVERCLVDDDLALLAAQRAGFGGERDDRIAGRKVDPERLDAFLGPIVVENFGRGGRGPVERLGESRAVVDELARHIEIVGDVEDVHAAPAGGGGQYGVRAEPVSDARAARLLDDEQLVLACEAQCFLLIGQEEVGRRVHAVQLRPARLPRRFSAGCRIHLSRSHHSTSPEAARARKRRISARPDRPSNDTRSKCGGADRAFCGR